MYKNKNIILVGNSVEMMFHDYGEFIDGHDIVVRLGKGVPDTHNRKHIGVKTDVWGTGFLRQNFYKKFPHVKKILLNRMRINLLNNRVPDFPVEHDVMFSDKELIAISKEFGFEINAHIGRPSNGFLTILYFLRKQTDWKSFTIIGFDFFSKQLSFKVGEARPYSWHLPVNSIEENPHYPEVERNAILKYANEIPNFKWVVLSDFKQETIF